MHNTYVRPDGLWPTEHVLTPGDLRRFDVAQYQALNGDAGGVYDPLSPITWGGAGVMFTGGGGGYGHHFTGGVATASGGRLRLGASIYPTFALPYARVIQWPLLARPTPALALTMTQHLSGVTLGAVVGSLFSTTSLGAMVLPIPSRQLHHGATLASADVSMRVGLKHSIVPAALPQARVLRSDYAPWKALTWFPGIYCPPGTLIQATYTYDPDGWPWVYVASGAGGGAGGTEPNWNTATGINQSPALDGAITWVNVGYSAIAGAWGPARAYVVGVTVSPVYANGLVYVVTAVAGTGTSGATEPVWPLAPGATVVDNPGVDQVTWTCIGTPRAAAWTPATAYVVGALVCANPDNSLYYQATVAGTSGGI